MVQCRTWLGTVQGTTPSREPSPAPGPGDVLWSFTIAGRAARDVARVLLASSPYSLPRKRRRLERLAAWRFVLDDRADKGADVLRSLGYAAVRAHFDRRHLFFTASAPNGDPVVVTLVSAPTADCLPPATASAREAYLRGVPCHIVSATTGQVLEHRRIDYLALPAPPRDARAAA
jgi:hypothetical protein